MKQGRKLKAGWSPVVVAMLTLVASQAHSFTFELGAVSGSFDSTVGAGIGVRTQSPQCDLVARGAQGTGAPAGCLDPLSAGALDQGDLNYRKNRPFTQYLKGTHELLLKAPDQWTLMARGTWFRDFAGTRLTGFTSAALPVGAEMPEEAADDVRFKARLLDAWVGKSFSVGDAQVRVRLGKQVLNWGESLFLSGGISSTQASDFNRLSQPGTQIKEGLLATPLVNASIDLGAGVGIEAYAKFGWDKSYLPPVGSYWSTSTGLGVGNSFFGVTEVDAKKSGQFGAAVRWRPAGSDINLAAYYVKYHDNLPNLLLDQTTFAPTWVYAEKRSLFGLSANAPIGDWAVASEISYRPKEIVSLYANSGCTTRNGKCYAEEGRVQLNVNGVYSMTRTNAPGLLRALGADAANLFIEGAFAYFPGLKSDYDGLLPEAGYAPFGQETDAAAAPYIGATRLSGGLAFDLSVSYDGTLLPGWTVTPGLYFYRGLKGRTPTVAATYMKGAQTMNFYLNLLQTGGAWNITANYARFSGGTPFDNLFRDRDYVGLTVLRSF